MLITYVDESQRGERYYFIGALTVTREALIAVETSLDAIVNDAATAYPGLDPRAELHAVDIFHSERDWAGVPPRLSIDVCKKVIGAIADSGARFVFRGTDRVALKAKYVKPNPVHEMTLMHALGDVDKFIRLRQGAERRTLVIADEHHAADSSRSRFRFVRNGSGGGFNDQAMTQLVDTIYFGPSKESRLLQAADMATFFMNRALTITENDKRAEKAMQEILTTLRTFTDRCYFWPPDVTP